MSESLSPPETLAFLSDGQIQHTIFFLSEIGLYSDFQKRAVRVNFQLAFL